jgi:TP901 family phage tail tape measure protein
VTVSAGKLTWDLDVSKANEVLQKVDSLGRAMGQALNKGRNANTGLPKVGTDADAARSRIERFGVAFKQLQGEFRSGNLSATQYGQRLTILQGGMQRLQQSTTLTAKEWGQYGSILKRVQTEHSTFGGTAAAVTARTKELVNEVHRLRNNWQETGQATDATKARMHALVNEIQAYRQELSRADQGTVRFAGNLRQLNTAGRSGIATIDGMEGRMSRLGLASQVNLAAQQAVTAQFYRFGPAGQVAGSALGIVSGGMATMSAATLGLGTVLAVTLAGVVSLNKTGTPQVREFQEALAVLRASGERFSEAGLAESLESVRDAAGRAGDLFTRAEMATALAELVKAGIDSAEAMDLLAPGMQLAAVTGQSLNETTSALLANLRQFGLDTSEAGRAADALAAADLAAAHGAAELSEGLATVGPVARAAGLTLEDTLGILVELDNKGLDPADKGATALRGTMSALLDPTKEALEVLAGLGVELKNTDGSSRPLLTVLNELQQALNGNSEAAQEAAKIFDTRAITAILNMTDKSTGLADSLRDSSGALRAYADEMMRENLAKAETARAKAWQDLAHTMSTQAIPALRTFNEQLARYFRIIDNASQRPWWQQGNTIGGILSVRDMIFGPPNNANDPAAPNGNIIDFANPGSQFGPRTRPADWVDKVTVSVTELISEAIRLKAAIEGASDGEQWIAATRNIETFRASSDDAAEAWSYVNRSVKTTATTIEKEVATVESTFKDLEDSGIDAERRALAFGNTLGAMIESAQTRGRLVGQALNTLLVDFGLDPLSAEVQFLVSRLAQLEVEITTLQARLNPTTTPYQRTAMTLAEASGPTEGMRTGLTPKEIRDALLASPAFKAAQEEAADAWRAYGRAIRKAATVAERYDGQEILGPTAGMRGGLTTTEIRALLKDALDRALQAYLDSVTSPFRQTAMVLAEAGGPSEGIAGGLGRDEVLEALRGSPAHKQNVREAELAWRDYVNAVQGWAQFADERLGAEIGGPSGGMSTGMTPAEIRAALEAAVERRWQEFRAEMTRPTRQTAMQLAEVGGPSAGMATGMTPSEIRDALSGALPTVEKLQRALINLRNQGFDANSQAVQRLVRQINELELRAALKELREKGLKGLSDFNRQVLIANGVLPGATVKARSFSDALRTLAGNDVADGLADIIDGIKAIREAGSDAEGVVKGLTLALNGATKVVESLSSGDLFETVKSLAMLAGEGIGQITNTPGLGQAVGGVLDLGKAIVTAISDVFTGDSPAARALREGLTPSIASAFTQGIINGIRGAEGWQEGLRDGVKMVFLQSLVEAFVQGAIIQTYLAPIIAEYSKLLAKGNVEGAKAYLDSSLGPALEQAYAAAESFVGTIPAWLIPTGGGSAGSSSSPQQSDASFHSLPIAQVAGGPPAWTVDLLNSVNGFGRHVDRLGGYVDRLVDEGITVNQGSRRGGGSAAAARAA